MHRCFEPIAATPLAARKTNWGRRALNMRRPTFFQLLLTLPAIGCYHSMPPIAPTGREAVLNRSQVYAERHTVGARFAG